MKNKTLVAFAIGLVIISMSSIVMYAWTIPSMPGVDIDDNLMRCLALTNHKYPGIEDVMEQGTPWRDYFLGCYDGLTNWGT